MSVGTEAAGRVKKEPAGTEATGRVKKEPAGTEAAGRVKREPVGTEAVRCARKEPAGNEAAVRRAKKEPDKNDVWPAPHKSGAAEKNGGMVCCAGHCVEWRPALSPALRLLRIWSGDGCPRGWQLHWRVSAGCYGR